MPKVEQQRTYKIKAVEIFSVGEWNGDKYSVNDLHAIVESFNALKVGFRPYLKLGHDDSQKLAKSSGLPAVGWVENIYVKGQKLLADMEYIPEKVYKLIESRAYRKVSCEIYWDLTVDGNKYSRVLGGIAFLGAENPGVMNLDDILGNYQFMGAAQLNNFEKLEKQDTLKTYSSNLNYELEDVMPDKTEKEIQLETQLETEKRNYAKLEAEKKEAAEAKEKAEKEIEELKAYKIESEKREAIALAEADKAKREKFIGELESKKLATPAMKEMLYELLTDKKEYSVGDKKLSKETLVEEILKLSSEAAKVNFDENSSATYSKDKSKKDEEEIEKYMQENKCSYVQAYKAVMKSKNGEE